MKIHKEEFDNTEWSTDNKAHAACKHYLQYVQLLSTTKCVDLVFHCRSILLYRVSITNGFNCDIRKVLPQGICANNKK